MILLLINIEFDTGENLNAHVFKDENYGKNVLLMKVELILTLVYGDMKFKSIYDIPAFYKYIMTFIRILSCKKVL